MTPQQFHDAYLATAVKVSAGTGLDVTTLLAQWALETGWATSWAGYPCNLGNIRCSPTSFCQYATLDDFAANCIATFFNGYYGAVLATAGQSIETQITALGVSPWDAGHYGNPPGSALIPYAQELDMFSDQDRQTLANIFNATFRSVAPAADPWVKVAIAQDASQVKAIVAALPGSQPEPPEPVEPPDLTAKVDALTAAVARIEAALKGGLGNPAA